MSEPDLHVKIPERFREGFSRRFDPARATLADDRWTIPEPCGLCGEFYAASSSCCEGCPFKVFRQGSYGPLGCTVWIRAVLRTSLAAPFICTQDSMGWCGDRDTLAREQLTTLRQRAEELIEWISDTPQTRSETMLKVTATLKEPEIPPEPRRRTLADLGDDVLARIEFEGSTSFEPRFAHRGQVYGLEGGDSGEVRRTGGPPDGYAVLEVLGPLTYSFEV